MNEGEATKMTLVGHMIMNLHEHLDYIHPTHIYTIIEHTFLAIAGKYLFKINTD